MTDTPNPESTITPDTQPKPKKSKFKKPKLDLPALYPACFDWENPRPLKIGIREDLIAAGHNPKLVRHALLKYCAVRRYLKATQAKARRIDLQGKLRGVVTKRQAAVAKAKLKGTWGLTPPPEGYNKTTRRKSEHLNPHLPIDIPLTEDNIVSGRLELTLKFSDLPKPMPVKNGMKIGIKTDTGLVVAILPLRAWNKLVKAQAEWPLWVAALTGKLGKRAGADGASVVVLESPALQVFEKKPKPVA